MKSTNQMKKQMKIAMRFQIEIVVVSIEVLKVVNLTVRMEVVKVIIDMVLEMIDIVLEMIVIVREMTDIVLEMSDIVQEMILKGPLTEVRLGKTMNRREIQIIGQIEIVIITGLHPKNIKETGRPEDINITPPNA